MTRNLTFNNLEEAMNKAISSDRAEMENVLRGLGEYKNKSDLLDGQAGHIFDENTKLLSEVDALYSEAQSKVSDDPVGALEDYAKAKSLIDAAHVSLEKHSMSWDDFAPRLSKPQVTHLDLAETYRAEVQSLIDDPTQQANADLQLYAGKALESVRRAIAEFQKATANSNSGSVDVGYQYLNECAVALNEAFTYRK